MNPDSSPSLHTLETGSPKPVIQALPPTRPSLIATVPMHIASADAEVVTRDLAARDLAALERRIQRLELAERRALDAARVSEGRTKALLDARNERINMQRQLAQRRQQHAAAVAAHAAQTRRAAEEERSRRAAAARARSAARAAAVAAQRAEAEALVAQVKAERAAEVQRAAERASQLRASRGAGPSRPGGPRGGAVEAPHAVMTNVSSTDAPSPDTPAPAPASPQRPLASPRTLRRIEALQVQERELMQRLREAQMREHQMKMQIEDELLESAGVNNGGREGTHTGLEFSAVVERPVLRAARGPRSTGATPVHANGTSVASAPTLEAIPTPVLASPPQKRVQLVEPEPEPKPETKPEPKPKAEPAPAPAPAPVEPKAAPKTPEPAPKPVLKPALKTPESTPVPAPAPALAPAPAPAEPVRPATPVLTATAPTAPTPEDVPATPAEGAEEEFEYSIDEAGNRVRRVVVRRTRTKRVRSRRSRSARSLETLQPVETDV